MIAVLVDLVETRLVIAQLPAGVVVQVNDRDRSRRWTAGIGSEVVELELDGAVVTPLSIPDGIELVVDDYDCGVFGETFRRGADDLPRLARAGVWDLLRHAA
jgi:hypothetical protein